MNSPIHSAHEKGAGRAASLPANSSSPLLNAKEWVQESNTPDCVMGVSISKT